MNIYNQKLFKLVLSVGICLIVKKVEAQLVEIPLSKLSKNATIVSFKEPFQEITIDIEDDENNDFRAITTTNQTSFSVKDNSKLKNSTPDYFRPGMKINISYDYYRISQKYIAKSIVLVGSYYGRVSLTGLIEKVQQNQAVIDGQRVVLDSGSILTGLDEWRGIKINKFAELELGSEVKVQGRSKDDGIVYVSKGTFQPISSKIRKEYRQIRNEWSDAIYADNSFLYIGDNIKFQIIKDSTLEAYIHILGQRLIPKYLRMLPINHPDKIHIHFFIVKNEEMSSLALADGTIILYSGLLSQIENEAQLAAIICHELAHITHYHSIEKNDFLKTSNAMAELLKSDTTRIETNSYSYFSQISTQMQFHSKNRRLELEADKVGLWYMIDAGYNPRQAALLWERLIGLYKPSTGGLNPTIKSNIMTQNVGNLYSTHPSFKQRYMGIMLILSTIYINEAFNDLIINTVDYQMFQQRLSAGLTEMKTISR